MPLLSRKRKVTPIDLESNYVRSILYQEQNEDTEIQINHDKINDLKTTNNIDDHQHHHQQKQQYLISHESVENELQSPLKIARTGIQTVLTENNSQNSISKSKKRQKKTSSLVKRNRQTELSKAESKRRKKQEITTTIKVAENNSQEMDRLEQPDFIQMDTNSLFDREEYLSTSIDLESSTHFSRIDDNNVDDLSNSVVSSNGVDFGNSSNHCISSGQYSNYQKSLKQINDKNLDKDKFFTGDVGHIQEITLQNFMCHTHFHLELGPRVNFIVGQNGSGKSAILNGIILGLGGRASNTNRGSGLSTFIKNGESKARIILKLANFIEGKKTSEESYQYDRYGKSIIIERTITINGQSSYKIKSESGRIISEKKEELDNILNHLSLYIDNPICVLTQEVSKNFLNSKSASDKFKFFVKATQLDDTKKDYVNSNVNYINSLKLIKEKEELLKFYKNKLEEYRRKVEIIETLRNSVVKFKQLNEEALWAHIIELEEGLAKQVSNLEEHEKKCESCCQQLEAIQSKMAEVDGQKMEFMERLKNFSLEVKRASEELNEAKRKAQEMRKQLTDKETNLRIIKNDLNHHINEIDDLKKRIGGLEKNSQECEQIDIDTMIENMVEELEMKKISEEELKVKVKQLQNDNEELIQKRIHLNQEERKISTQINSYISEVERLSRSEKNRLGRYGPKFPELNAQIDLLYKQKKFKHKPFGPIGEYIRLQDSSSAYAVETCLKSMLYAYVVDNGDDSRVLKALTNRLFNTKSPPVIIRKFAQLHDVSQTQTTSLRYQNFLQLLNIKRENDPVANCLIDHLRIEQILYIPDFKEAQHILIRKELVPKNCNVAYTSGGDLMYPSNQRGDYKCYPNKRRDKLVRILVQDQGATKENYRREIEVLKKKQEELYEKSREQNKLIEENKKIIMNTNHQINELKMEQINKETQLAELKAKTTIKPVEAQALKEEVEKLEEERDNLQNQVDELIGERKTLSEKYIQLEKESDAKIRAYQDVLDSRDPIKEQIDKLNDQSHELLQKINYMEKEKENLLKIKYKNEKDIMTLKEDLMNKEQSALERTTNRIETDRSLQQILKEAKRIEMIIDDNQNMCDAEKQNQIYEEFNELNTSMERVKTDLDNLNKYFLMFKKSIFRRQKAYEKMKLYITNIVNYYFQNFLRQKEFIGSIHVYFNEHIDHESGNRKKAKTLEIDIKPRKEFANSQQQMNSQGIEIQSYSSTKSLSGGERSFSTVAFIIALWEICQSPFKILDEVDVFMDMVTRKISLDTLVEFAAVKSHKQYIFLSPLQLQRFSHDECIKIFQMPEPERKS